MTEKGNVHVSRAATWERGRHRRKEGGREGEESVMAGIAHPRLFSPPTIRRKSLSTRSVSVEEAHVYQPACAIRMLGISSCIRTEELSSSEVTVA